MSGDVIPDSGAAVEPAKLDTVVSLRLRADFAAMLRDAASRRGVNLSDLLRLAAGAVLCEEGLCTCPSCPVREKGGTTHA